MARELVQGLIIDESFATTSIVSLINIIIGRSIQPHVKSMFYHNIYGYTMHTYKVKYNGVKRVWLRETAVSCV